MPDRPSQCPFICTFQNHCRKADGADLDSPQRRTFTDSGARAFGSRKVRFLQRSFKAPGLFSLIEPRVEHREADVTQRQKADDQKDVSAPTENRIGSRQQKYLPFIS